MTAPQAIDMVHRLAIASIDASGRLRRVDQDHARVIADSILALRASGKDSGLQHPITVRPVGEGYKLVIGAHRLAACTLLGDDDIDAVIKPMTEDEARLAEIDENLCRHELTMFDRAAFLAERDALWKRLNPALGKGKAGAKARWHHASDKMSFASEVADKVGLSQRQIQRDVKMFNLLAPEVRTRISGTWLADHQAQLKALSKLPPQTQERVVFALFRPDSKLTSVAAALAQVEGRKQVAPSPDDTGFQALMRAWKNAPAAARTRFLDEIGAATAEKAA